jgi:hypothetical protein
LQVFDIISNLHTLLSAKETFKTVGCRRNPTQSGHSVYDVMRNLETAVTAGHGKKKCLLLKSKIK